MSKLIYKAASGTRLGGLTHAQTWVGRQSSRLTRQYVGYWMETYSLKIKPLQYER
jgi:hypothetical protein